MTRVVAINGSPRLEKGNTHVVLTPFLQGMTDAGAGVELFYASRLDVEPCTGEFHCWYEKPGECYIKDDMELLYPELREAEILVLATPVYIPLPGEMQNVINRLCALIDPTLETREGRTRARFHKDVKIKKIVLVSTSGWWEMGNFDTVVRIVQELAEDARVAFAGAVLRPHAYLMKEDGELTQDGKAVQEAARKAGNELVEEGSMKQETLEQVSRPLISQEEFRLRSNQDLE
ncbi:MAG TPA: flavodoxin family protein [Anaerolineae bacterium]|nr:flavodoxin family protein [Anaerolineae bacterium]